MPVENENLQSLGYPVLPTNDLGQDYDIIYIMVEEVHWTEHTRLIYSSLDW